MQVLKISKQEFKKNDRASPNAALKFVDATDIFGATDIKQQCKTTYLPSS